MDLGLQGKRAVVFASSKGIGRGIAQRLAQEGASVAICARGEEALRRTEAEIRAAGGDVRVLLNQDTEVRPGWLAALAAAFASDAMLGIAGSKAVYPDGRIQHAGGYLDDRGEGHHDGQGETDLGQWDAGRDVAYVSGASLAISRRALQAAGGGTRGGCVYDVAAIAARLQG